MPRLLDLGGVVGVRGGLPDVVQLRLRLVGRGLGVGRLPVGGGLVRLRLVHAVLRVGLGVVQLAHVVGVGLGLRVGCGLVRLGLVVLGGLPLLLGLLLVPLRLIGGIQRGLILALRLLQRGVGLIQLGGGVVTRLLLRLRSLRVGVGHALLGIVYFGFGRRLRLLGLIQTVLRVRHGLLGVGHVGGVRGLLRLLQRLARLLVRRHGRLIGHGRRRHARRGGDAGGDDRSDLLRFGHFILPSTPQTPLKKRRPNAKGIPRSTTPQTSRRVGYQPAQGAPE